MGNDHSAPAGGNNVCPRDFSINLHPGDMEILPDTEEVSVDQNYTRSIQYVDNRYVTEREVAFMFMTCSSLIAACDIDMQFVRMILLPLVFSAIISAISAFAVRSRDAGITFSNVWKPGDDSSCLVARLRDDLIRLP